MVFRRSDSVEIQKQKAAQLGVPYWCDLNSYPKTWDALSLDQKRWEFLRRSQEYRGDWKKLCDNPLVIKKVEGERWRKSTRSGIAPSVIAEKYGITVPMSPSLSWETRDEHFSFIVPEVFGGEIVYPNTPCPRTKEYEAYRESLKEKSRNVLPYDASPKKPDWYDRRIWIEFDLSSDPAPQIEAAVNNFHDAISKAQRFMSWLESPDGTYDEDDYIPLPVWDRNLRKTSELPVKREEKDDAVSMEAPRPSRMLQMLRICDASDCGVTYKDIANELEKTEYSLTENSVIKRYKAAQDVWRRLQPYTQKAG